MTELPDGTERFIKYKRGTFLAAVHASTIQNSRRVWWLVQKIHKNKRLSLTLRGETQVFPGCFCSLEEVFAPKHREPAIVTFPRLGLKQ